MSVSSFILVLLSFPLSRCLSSTLSVLTYIIFCLLSDHIPIYSSFWFRDFSKTHIWYHFSVYISSAAVRLKKNSIAESPWRFQPWLPLYHYYLLIVMHIFLSSHELFTLISYLSFKTQLKPPHPENF